MKKSLLSICVMALLGCSSAPKEPGPRTIIEKHYDPGYVINYPGGASAYKPEAYWFVLSDESYVKVDREEWERREVGSVYQPG